MHKEVNTLFDSGLEAHLIKSNLVNNHGLEVHYHPNPYPLGYKYKGHKKCKIIYCKWKFYWWSQVSVAPLGMCVVVFGSPYMYIKDVIFMKKENWYHLIKNGNLFIMNANKYKSKISLVCAYKTKKLISTSKKYVFLFLREN